LCKSSPTTGWTGLPADCQRLTAEGKLGEAGQKLEQLKRKLDDLSVASKVIISENGFLQTRCRAPDIAPGVLASTVRFVPEGLAVTPLSR